MGIMYEDSERPINLPVMRVITSFENDLHHFPYPLLASNLIPRWSTGNDNHTSGKICCGWLSGAVSRRRVGPLVGRFFNQRRPVPQCCHTQHNSDPRDPASPQSAPKVTLLPTLVMTLQYQSTSVAYGAHVHHANSPVWVST